MSAFWRELSRAWVGPLTSPAHRTVDCPTCYGEGFIAYGHPNAPYAARTVDCEECRATGEIEVQLRPIDEEDLCE